MDRGAQGLAILPGGSFSQDGRRIAHSAGYCDFHAVTEVLADLTMTDIVRVRRACGLQIPTIQTPTTFRQQANRLSAACRNQGSMGAPTSATKERIAD